MDLTGKLGDIQFKAENESGASGQSAAIYLKDERIGFIGVVHPELERVSWITMVVRWCLNWNGDKLADRIVPQARGGPNFPANRRDIAVVVCENV